MVRIGLIGGSGIYNMKGLEVIRKIHVKTPFGDPSAAVVIGKLEGVEVAFLPRHGEGHVFNPSEVNYRANIFALKSLGVEFIIGVSAVGSLRDEIKPGDVVLIDQFIDRTHHRQHTFFEKGIVGHVSVAHPVCKSLLSVLQKACQTTQATHHVGGTYINMEGPAFSTYSESQLYRSWGAHVIGMTCLPEAKLAREAEISYAVLAMATDYDCWHPDHDNVTVEAVVAVLHRNVSTSQNIVREAVKILAKHEGPCWQHEALKAAIMTAPDKMNPNTLRKLAPLLKKYHKIPRPDMPDESLLWFILLSAGAYYISSVLHKQ